MSVIASEVLVDILIHWGVQTVFGMPGDGANGFMEVMRSGPNDIRLVRVRHEETAAFIPTGWATYTGKLGACMATSGQGVEGNPEYSCELQPIDFADPARSCGGEGFVIDSAEECEATLDATPQRRAPVMIEVVVDPLEPPKETMEQATELAKSLAKGEPGSKDIMNTILKNRTRELL